MGTIEIDSKQTIVAILGIKTLISLIKKPEAKDHLQEIMKDMFNKLTYTHSVSEIEQLMDRMEKDFI